MRKLTLALALVTVVAVGVGLGVFARRGASGRPPDASPTASLMGLPVSVQVARAERGFVRESVRYVGSVEGHESVTILPKVTGILRSITVDIGDRVSKGNLIATIDDAEFAQRLEQAKANLKLAEAQLERSRINLGSFEREYTRSESLVRLALVPEQELDLAMTRRDAARADVDLAQAEVTRARAALDEASLNLENTRIIARLSGYVDKRRVDPGALVSPTTALCTIVATDPAKVVFNVPENDVPLVRVGQPALVQVGGSDVEHRGTIGRIAPTIDPATRTAVAQITVPNAAGALRPGMYADVMLVVREKSSALTVPEEALLRRNGQTDVMRVVDDVARSTPVTLGIVGGGRAEVIAGLDDGDAVIVKGQYLIEDGDRVTSRSAQEQAADSV